MKYEKVEFTKCQEYNPLHNRANSLGMRTFWRADYYGNDSSYAYGETIATLCDTKKECIEEVRRIIKIENSKLAH